MTGLTADDLALLHQRLAEAESDARAEALASRTSFLRFLERPASCGWCNGFRTSPPMSRTGWPASSNRY